MSNQFRTIYDQKYDNKIYSCPKCSFERDDYGFVIDKDGNEVLQVTGKTNFYELIQSHSKEADLHSIFAKVTASGDVSLLNVRGCPMFSDQRGDAASFTDATNMPKTLLEAHDVISTANGLYSKLSPEKKAIFDADGPDALFKSFVDDAVAAAVAASKKTTTGGDKNE